MNFSICNKCSIFLSFFLVIVMICCVGNRKSEEFQDTEKYISRKESVRKEEFTQIILDSNLQYRIKISRDTEELEYFNYSLSTKNDTIQFKAGGLDTFYLFYNYTRNTNIIVLKSREGVNNFLNLFLITVNNDRLFMDSSNPQFFENVSGEYRINTGNGLLEISGKRHVLNDPPCCPSESFNVKLKIKNKGGNNFILAN